MICMLKRIIRIFTLNGWKWLITEDSPIELHFNKHLKESQKQILMYNQVFLQMDTFWVYYQVILKRSKIRIWKTQMFQSQSLANSSSDFVQKTNPVIYIDIVLIVIIKLVTAVSQSHRQLVLSGQEAVKQKKNFKPWKVPKQ